MGKGNENVFVASGSVTQMAATPIYVVNKGTDIHETWYVASGRYSHHSLYK